MRSEYMRLVRLIYLDNEKICSCLSLISNHFFSSLDIGADILDSAGDSAMYKFSGKLKEEPTDFELSPREEFWHK